MNTQFDLAAAKRGEPVTTRDGREVTIYTTEAPGDHPVHGCIKGIDSPHAWGANGNYYYYSATSLDLFTAPTTDWSKVPVDTKVRVRESEHVRWLNRYFAGFRGGVVFVWQDGCTSWSKHGDCSWKYTELVELNEPAMSAQPTVTVTRWLNLYGKERTGYLNLSREEADSQASAGRVACIEIQVPFGVTKL